MCVYIGVISLIGFSSLVYVEADANLRTYEDAEGKRQSHLNLTQRESLPDRASVLVSWEAVGWLIGYLTGSLELLKRSYNSENAEPAAPSEE